MIPEDRCRDVLERVREDIEFRNRRWEEGQIADDLVPKHAYGLAGRYETLGHCHALLGDGAEAVAAYAEAARYYVTRVREARARRDELEASYWEHEPAVLVRAMTAAQLARADDAAAEAAREALAMDDAYLDRFEPEYDDSPFRYYNAKLRGAITLDDGRRADLLEAYRDAVAPLDNPYADAMGDVYAALVDGDAGRVERGLEALLDYHDETVTSATDHPDDFVADTPASLWLLARERGLDASVDSEYVPDALAPSNGDANAVPTGRETSPEARGSAGADDVPHVEPVPETGGYAIVESVAHPADRELTVSDLPETNHGRVLTDEWLDGVVDDLRRRDEEFPRELGAELRRAREAGTLERKLVVVQDGRGAPRFDESVAELVDRIEAVKRGDDSG